MAKPTTSSPKIDDRISRAFSRRCNRIAVSILDLPKIYQVGQAAIAGGADDAALEDAIHAFVQTIRKN